MATKGVILNSMPSQAESITGRYKYNPRDELVKLANKTRTVYPLFNVFELSSNRFARLENFIHLTRELIVFNEELTLRKDGGLEIRNLVITYSLYENMFDRLKSICNLATSSEEARKGFAEIMQWFYTYKPLIRNWVDDKQVVDIKQQSESNYRMQDEEEQIQSSKIRREMKVYETLARTAHADFFPPKDRLAEYQRKEIINTGIDLNRGRVSSVASVKRKMVDSRRQSLVATRSTFQNTASSFKPMWKVDKEAVSTTPTPFRIAEHNDELQAEMNEIADALRSRKANQYQIMYQSLVQPNNYEDYPEVEGYGILNYSSSELKYKHKKFVDDPYVDDEARAEYVVKDVKQSTLRRLLDSKYNKVRGKLYYLYIKKHMKNWAATKSRGHTEISRRIERGILVNKFRDVAYSQAAKTFSERQGTLQKDIPSFEVYQRSKSSHQKKNHFEGYIYRKKCSNTLKKLGRYIDHVNTAPVVYYNPQYYHYAEIMKSNSLTSFVKQGKKKPFSAVLHNGVYKYNEQVLYSIIRIKDTLAKKFIAIDNNSLFKSLAITASSEDLGLPEGSIYTSGRNLLSNPYFPKQLYATKAKKKK